MTTLKERTPSAMERAMSDKEMLWWMRFATRVATKYAGRWDPEYQSIAGRALLRAMRTFDEAKNVPFYGWVAFLVRRALAYNFRRAKKAKTRTVQENLFWQLIPDTRDTTETPVWDALAALPEFDREVIRLHWIEGLTVREIAARFPGVSAKRLYTYMGTLKAKLWSLREDLRIGSDSSLKPRTRAVHGT